MSVDTSPPSSAPATAAEQFALRRQSPMQRVQHVLHSHPALSPLMVLIVACILIFPQRAGQHPGRQEQTP